MRIPVVIGCILALLFLPSCSREKATEKPAQTATPIRTGKARLVQGPEVVSVSGAVSSPDAPVSVSFLVSGKVTEVGPREGDYVEAGKLLAVIDPTDYTLAVQAASAQTKQAQVAFDRSRDEFARMKFLYESRSLPGNDFDKFKAAYLSAKEQVDLAAANEKLARKRLGDASLHAPTGGFISKRAVEPGETASPGRPVFEIVRLDPVEIRVGVPETDVHLMRPGQAAAITIPALPGESFEGRVTLVNVSADPGTRTYLTRITVPNPAHRLRVGMVAEAKIRGDKIVQRLTIPVEAIVRSPQGAPVVYIYSQEEGHVHARQVETGALNGREIVILNGLSGEEAIVLAGQEKLRDGAPVTLAEDPAAAGNSSQAPRKEGAAQ